MNRSLVSRWLLVGLLMMVGTPAVAQSGTLRGRVQDDAGRGLAGVRVEIPAVGAVSLTRPDGTFELSPVPDGSHQVTATVLGHRTATRSVVAKGPV